MTDNKFKYQGVGREYQKQLLTSWYERQQSAHEVGRKVAYLFVPGNIAEFLRPLLTKWKTDRLAGEAFGNYAHRVGFDVLQDLERV